MSGDATDAAGTGIGPAACSNCVGCSPAQGDLGLADAAVVRLRGEHAGVQLVWQCPGCGREVVEGSGWLSTQADSRRVAADPLCHHCR